MRLSYYSYVTGEIDKAIQTYTEWARTYSADYVPHDNLGDNYDFLGQYEKAAEETNASLRIEPDDAIAYGNLADDYLALDRIKDAKACLGRGQPSATWILRTFTCIDIT